MAINTKSRLGYFYGLTEARSPRGEANQSNAEKFQSDITDQGAYYAIGSRLPREKSRMAGDILNITLSPGTPTTLSLPQIGGAEIRNTAAV